MIDSNEKNFELNTILKDDNFENNINNISKDAFNTQNTEDSNFQVSNLSSDSSCDKDNLNDLEDNVTNNENENNDNESENKLENDTTTLDNNDSQICNCLALTVKKDYNLAIVKNVIVKTLKNCWRVAISFFTLNFLKFFM